MEQRLGIIEKEKIVRAHSGGLWPTLLRHLKALAVTALVLFAAYAVNAVLGFRAVSQTSGTLHRIDVNAPVEILRDDRDVPHIRAGDLHDAFFAEGFAAGSDRLFQMDLIRRFVYGDLAEVFGPIQLPSDQMMRYLDVRDIAARQWAHASDRERGALRAYADGVNAAIRTQPLPVEFRLALYQPAPWTPVDSLAVTLAVSATLIDSPYNVLQRDDLWRKFGARNFARLFPLSDSFYDVSLTGVPQSAGAPARSAWAQRTPLSVNPRGSNAWAAGANRTRDGRALLANDPHLDVSIPGIWYMVEMRAPGFHAAGVTIPGVPGVVLGHNERIAWGTTNATVASVSVFKAPHLSSRYWKRETFAVRFGRDVTKTYYRTPREFGLPDPQSPGDVVLVRWNAYSSTRSAFSTILALDTAASARAAVRAIATYSGPAQNFVVADSAGYVAYHLAGPVPEDPVWGRHVHAAADLQRTYAPIPFAQLPSMQPSRNATIVSANNKMYGDGYPYRLSAMFAPPYRAYRIAELLRERHRYDVAYFAQMQLDDKSPVDAAFAHRAAKYAASRGTMPPWVAHELLQWDGRFAPDSQAATLERALRSENASDADTQSPYVAAISYASLSNAYDLPDFDKLHAPWGRAGAIIVPHPFGPIGFPMLNGATLPGDGDRYTIRVQTPDLAQSFRAVWEPGAWDRGGIVIPSGESGEVGSAHYTDLSRTWVDGRLQPLPFSDRSVRNAAKERLTLLSW